MPSDRSAFGRPIEGTLWISESSCGTAAGVSAPYPPPPPPMLSSGTQTLTPSLVDVAVSTNVVMDEFSFRCIACSKPPTGPKFYTKDWAGPAPA